MSGSTSKMNLSTVLNVLWGYTQRYTPLCITHHSVILILRKWVTLMAALIQRKLKPRVLFLSLSPLQLQDGYSNNNSSSIGSQQCVSQPATPGGALPVPSPLSPSPASLSSYHGDDSDSISSPPWPLKTPSSPVRARNSNSIGQMDVGIYWITGIKLAYRHRPNQET